MDLILQQRGVVSFMFGLQLLLPCGLFASFPEEHSRAQLKVEHLDRWALILICTESGVQHARASSKDSLCNLELRGGLGTVEESLKT